MARQPQRHVPGKIEGEQLARGSVHFRETKIALHLDPKQMLVGAAIDAIAVDRHVGPANRNHIRRDGAPMRYRQQAMGHVRVSPLPGSRPAFRP